jgi:hypothetical protein
VDGVGAGGGVNSIGVAMNGGNIVDNEADEGGGIYAGTQPR